MPNFLNAKTILKNTRLAKHEAEIALSSLSGKPRLEIYLDDPRLSLLQYLNFQRIVRARLRGFPLQYLLGEVEFFGSNLKVNKHVLIPRPETEIVLEQVIKKFKQPDENYRFLDMCTGSGAIAIAFARKFPNSSVLATDISKEALKVASGNAKINRVGERIEFLSSDLFDKVEGKFDLIFINPPYVQSRMIDESIELKYEPRIALDGGENGLDLMKRIFSVASGFLKDDGLLFIEIGENQTENLKGLLSNDAHLKLSSVIKDLNQKDRALEIAKK